VEAIASPTNDSRIVTKLFKMIIFSHFGVSRVLITDNGTHFTKKKLEALLKKYGVHHNYGLGYDPQTSGQAEISILEKMAARSRKGWADKLDDSLWAY